MISNNTVGTVTTIKNQHIPEVTEVPVKKVWDDVNDQDGIRDNETITFELYGVDKNTVLATYTFETTTRSFTTSFTTSTFWIILIS